MKAYILSTENGTVQIGHTVYCIPTKECFDTTVKGLGGKTSYTVPDNSWRSAKIALEMHYDLLYGEPGSTLAQ